MLYTKETCTGILDDNPKFAVRSNGVPTNLEVLNSGAVPSGSVDTTNFNAFSNLEDVGECPRDRFDVIDLKRALSGFAKASKEAVTKAEVKPVGAVGSEANNQSAS